MSRPLRIEYDNAFYHITARGNERKDIFKDAADRERFLEYLRLLNKRYKIIIYAYVLMNNHYHLLIETPQGNLSRVMRDLNGHYTIYFNKTYKRIGHFFQGRYKAILVDKDSYLLELSRYIHLNPVRARIVKRPEKYPHSSLSYYLKYKPKPAWLNTSWVLQQFSSQISQARQLYREFVYKGISQSQNPFKDLFANTILGSSAFIRTIKKKFLKDKHISRDIPESKKLQYFKSLKDIEETVLRYYNTDRASLIRKKSKFNNSKKIFIYLARQYTDNNLKTISNYFNKTLSSSAISKVFSRVEEELKRSNVLKKELRKIEQGIFDMSQVKT